MTQKEDGALSREVLVGEGMRSRVAETSWRQSWLSFTTRKDWRIGGGRGRKAWELLKMTVAIHL